MLPDDDIILTLWYAIETCLGEKNGKHYQAKLSLAETILCGVLFVLLGRSFRRFHRWLGKQKIFSSIPERSRLQRLVNQYSFLCKGLLGSKTFYGILDSFGIEIIHPIREGRSKQSQQVSGKGKSNHRWIVGRKVVVTINQNYEIVALSDDKANVHDNTFDEEQKDGADITLTDLGFKKKEGTPENFKICKKGEWNERMGVETLFSLWTRILNMKKSFHRKTEGFRAKLRYLAALTNIIMRKNEELGFAKLSMVQWSL